jgi:hypothetical protein
MFLKLSLEQYAQIATIVAALGTMFFSFLLWLVTKSSAKAAKESASVAKDSLIFQARQVKKAEEEKMFQAYFILRDIKKEATYIYNTVKAVADGNPDRTTIKYSKDIKRPNVDVLSTFIDKNKSEAIYAIWDKYDKYYSAYWYSSDVGGFSDRFWLENFGVLKSFSFECAGEIDKLIKLLD